MGAVQYIGTGRLGASQDVAYGSSFRRALARLFGGRFGGVGRRCVARALGRLIILRLA